MNACRGCIKRSCNATQACAHEWNRGIAELRGQVTAAIVSQQDVASRRLQSILTERMWKARCWAHHDGLTPSRLLSNNSVF